jgi:VWFA-related protein
MTRHGRLAGRSLVPVLLVVCTLAVLRGQQQPSSPQPASPPPESQAQQPPASPQQRPTFRAGANLVRVDVSVIDHHGEPVTDLTKDDFDVREDGAEQKVETFKLIEATGQPAEGDDLSLPIRSPEHAAAEAARDEIRVFVIFWDEYHIGQMLPAHLAREALTDFVRNAFGPTDLVALMDPLTPLDAIRFTRDRQALADKVHQLQGRLGIYLPARSPMEEAQMEMARDIEVIRSQVTASALEGTVLFLRSLKEGRKAILFVSQDIGPLGGRGMGGLGERYTWQDKVIQMANDSNTAIYTMDPRGLVGAASDVLRALADGTGAKLYQSNAPAASLRQIVKDASAFYLIGYSPPESPADGKYHKIKVRVKRPGVEVHARSGYFAPTLAEMESAHKAVAEELPPDVAHALSSIAPRPDSAGDFWAGAAPGAQGTPRVTVSWAPHDQAHAARVTVVATGADGTVFFDGPLTDGSASFDAKPGALKIVRTILDGDGAAGERDETSMTVPDFATATLAVASPTVFKARNGLELRQLHSSPDPVPYAGREFERTDHLLVRFSVIGASADTATVSANLLSRKGVALSVLPFAPVAGRNGLYEIDLPLGSIARGEYLIAIDVSNGAEHARALVSFRAT